MSRISTGLMGRICDGLAAHRVAPVGAHPDLVDVLGRLELVSGTEARLVSGGWTGAVEIGRETRQYIVEHPDAVWVVDLRTGTATGFSPPRAGRLDVRVPIRVPDSLRPRLEQLRLPKTEITPVASLEAGPDRLLILGMRAVAAINEEDARRVTCWIPNGGALELLVCDDGFGGTVLDLLDVVDEADAHTANAGPNLVVRLGARGGLFFVELGEQRGPGSADVRVFHPARSKLFDAWARYTGIARQEGEKRELARSNSPIEYFDATQRGRSWSASARLTPEALADWVGEVQEGRAVRVNQPAAVMRGRDEVGRVTVETLRLLGPGVVELLLRPERGTSDVPSSGTIASRENKGEKVRLQRERDALELLGKGAAACARLPLLLGTPEVATPPALAALQPAPIASLDAHQLHAVQAIVGCQDLVAVQGPPGTGKTGVIAEALRQIAARGRRDGRTYRVLISSVQNEAITNVLQRLAGVEGVLVNVLERAARDEEEGFRFADRLREQRARTVSSLNERLDRSEIAARLGRLRDMYDALDQLRNAAAVGPGGWPRLARQLRAVAEDDEAPLGHFARQEARSLATAFEALPEVAAPTVSGGVPPGAPTDPAEVEAWWRGAKPSWPAEHSAAVGSAVSDIARALALDNATLGKLAIERSLPRFRSALAATRWAPTVMAPPAPDTEAKLEAWLVTATSALREVSEDIERSPAAVAHRFARALAEDPRAWTRIVERHGNAVAATCSMSARAQPEPGSPYDWVIIDEAGRATPFELLIPAVQGVRVVFIGDHRQLPPTFDEAIVRRANEDDGVAIELDGATLFGELFTLLPSTNALRLGVQYRMHEAIGELVDRVFYRPHAEPLATYFTDGRVSDRWLVRDGSRPRTRGVFGDAPLVWHDVPSRQSCGESNPAEAAAVVKLLQRYADAGVEPGEIAVICPYQLQRAQIERALRDAPEARRIAEVRTIDAVQGREYAIVLLCLVRTDGRPGFLASPNRLNVAISRAQRQLVVIGTASVFRKEHMRTRAPELHAVVSAIVDATPREAM